MERVKYLRGGRGGKINGGGAHRREGGSHGLRGGDYMGEFLREGRGRGRGTRGGAYRGSKFGRGSKTRSGSMYGGHTDELDFTRKLQSSVETNKGLVELGKGKVSADCSSKALSDTNCLSASDLHISPEEKYDEKIGLISSRVSSTEASEYCKSHGSSQNPSPVGGCQEKFNTNSNFYGDSTNFSNYKHYKRRDFQSAYKGRKIFDRTQNEKTFGVKRKDPEKQDSANHTSEEPTQIKEAESSITKKIDSELPTYDEKVPYQEEEIQGSPSKILDEDLKSAEPSIEDQDEDKNSNCTDEQASNKSNSRIIGDVINWMMERQREAIQWLKDNGKYPQEDDAHNSSRKPQKFHQGGGLKEKRQAWNGGEQHTREKNRSFLAKYKGQNKDNPSSLYSSSTSVNPASQDKGDYSASENLELAHQKSSELSDVNVPSKNLGQRPDSRSKQRFEYNRRFNREKGGHFHFQNRTKEGESYISTETRNDSKGGERSSSRIGSFNTLTKYRNHYYRKQSVKKEL
ncbi:uncharacterized protein ELE39_001867 [Cryptosporidium sp. chipmunk genotype I]|uniref:uncharacterized protein n=1 Tax=Cryptosporidium sp. chipmunk genotype I TaxID=1280935 RepID=UPI00351A10FD|nr:hypothetical protein ELE39_001867 [Cryptosporidium sp. chipmunk genotype I]